VLHKALKTQENNWYYHTATQLLIF